MNPQDMAWWPMADGFARNSDDLTGRKSAAELIEVADTVSEIADVKHAYRASFRDKTGIDF